MTTISTPAQFVPVAAIGFGNIGTDATTVSSTTPLPISAPQATIIMAQNATLAAGASTSTFAIAQSGQYVFSYSLSGTSPSLALQALQIDGATWATVVSVSASGSQVINIAAGAGGAALRLTNVGSNAISALTSALVS